MGRIAVPYFIGTAMPGLVTPGPSDELSPPLPDGSPQERMAVLYHALADRVAADPDPFVYAGDCLAAIGVLAGLQQAGIDPTLVWFDAHGDFNTWQTTRSGFLGGMPLAMIVGRGEQTIVAGAGLTPLDERRVFLVGARDLDPGEDEAVTASSLTVLPVVRDLLRWDPPPGALHVHVDLDVVDPGEMPAQNYPAPGGPSLGDVRTVLARLAATGRVAAVSFSTWNPALPGAELAAAAATDLAAAITGGRPGTGDQRPA
jgi:arginase